MTTRAVCTRVALPYVEWVRSVAVRDRWRQPEALVQVVEVMR